MYKIFANRLNGFLRKIGSHQILPFSDSFTLRNFSCEGINGTSIEIKAKGILKQSAMAENKFLLFPKVASPRSNPSLFLRCFSSSSKVQRNSNPPPPEKMEQGKNSNDENQKSSSSPQHFWKDQAYNKNHLAFALKQVKEAAPRANMKLRYASEQTHTDKLESRIFHKPVASKVNYGHNVLSFIKEDLLDVRTMKDKMKCEVKGSNKGKDKSEVMKTANVPSPSDNRGSKSTAVIVIPEKQPLVQDTNPENAGKVCANKA